MARPLGETILATYGSIGVSFVWASRQWWNLGKPISTAKSEKKVGNKFFLTFGKVFSIMLNTIACWLFTWMISNSQVPLRTWTKHGQVSNEQSTSVTQNHMIDTLVVNMWSSTTSHYHEKLILLHMFLILKRLRQHVHNIVQMLFGNMTPSTKLGQGIISSHGRSCSSLAMRGGVCQVFTLRTGYNVRQKC